MGKKYFIFCWLLLFFSGCSQEEKDRGIKETLSSKAKKEVAFAGVNYIVKDGVVTLTGNAPSEDEKRKLEDKVKKLSGVKEVVNQLLVAPVVLDGDITLKQSVDSVLKSYPTVLANVQDSVVVLQGEVEKKKLPDLRKAVSELKAKGVHEQLTAR